MSTANVSTPAKSTAYHALSSSAYFGGGAAVLGATFFAGYATLKRKSAVVWGAAAGVQCFVLGSSFWFSRTMLRDYASQKHELSKREELGYSSLAGAFVGIAGGALRGRPHILPGAIVLGALGFGGQASFLAFGQIAEAPVERRSILDRLSDSRWWPLKSLSDEDYEKELSEKVIALEAEMAMIDETISSLREEYAKPINKS